MSEKLNRYSPHYDHDEERVSMSIDDSGDWVHIVRAKELMQERDEALRTKEGIKKFYSPEAAASLRAELAQSQALAALREHERDEARAWLEAAREEAGRYARALGSVEAVLGLAGDIPLISLADEAQAALKDVAERQREACAVAARLECAVCTRNDTMSPYAAESLNAVVRATPLVTEAKL